MGERQTMTITELARMGGRAKSAAKAAAARINGRKGGRPKTSNKTKKHENSTERAYVPRISREMNWALVQRMVALGITGRELASKAGVSELTVSRLRWCKSYPNEQTAQRIADALDIEREALFPTLHNQEENDNA